MVGKIPKPLITKSVCYPSMSRSIEVLEKRWKLKFMSDAVLKNRDSRYGIVECQCYVY